MPRAILRRIWHLFDSAEIEKDCIPQSLQTGMYKKCLRFFVRIKVHF